MQGLNVVFLVSLVIGWATMGSAGESVPAGAVFGSASESSSPSATFSDTPPEVSRLAPLLQRVVGIIQSSAEAEQGVAQLRTDHDAVKTRLTSINSEVELVTKQQEQWTQQVTALERQLRERMESLRSELEAKLEGELAASRQQVAQERQQDFDRQMQLFETRQQDAVGKALDQDLDLKERELQQLGQDIELQTRQLLERLDRLEASSDVAKTLERSTAQALARRKAALEARRSQLASERSQILAKQRAEFVQKLTMQQQADVKRRITLKEANLRQAMSELLVKTGHDEAKKVSNVRQALEEVRVRYNRLVQQQALLTTRSESLEKELASKLKSLETLETDRQASLAKLEEEFRQSNLYMVPGALNWFGRSIRYMPAQVAAELAPLQERLLAVADHDTRLAEQRRIIRERQLAQQLSQEMEAQHQQARLRQQREQQVRAKNADEFLAKARLLAGRGEYDQAIQALSQAQAINPPQVDQIVMAREELISTKERRQRESQNAQLEQLFAKAMKVFEQGRYEEAVSLFEEVIAREAKLEGPQVAGGSAP